MGSTKTRIESIAARERQSDGSTVGRRTDEPRSQSDQPGIFAGGIVADGGEMVESGDLSSAERLELEQVAAMAVSSWRLVGADASAPATARIEVPEADPSRRWRLAVTFDGDVAFVAFVDRELATEEFTALGRQSLKHWQRESPEKRRK